MKYTTEEALTEIMRRSEQVSIRRNHRACRRLSVSAGALMCLLVLVIGLFPSDGTVADGSVYGAFLLSAEAGGYVLAAVIAFALGVVITLLCLRLRNTRYHVDKANTKREETK